MLQLKKFPCILSKRLKSFITTPIFYVNANPHIGHLYSAVLADAAHRWNLLKHGKSIDEKDPNFTFSTGTDEHGIKIQSAAEQAGQSPHDYSTHISSRFKQMFDQFNISYTDFIRTTENRHREAVEAVWNRLLHKKLIQKGLYEGWYSTIDECFYLERDLDTVIENGMEIKFAKETKSPVEWIKEENYIFDLSPFLEKIREWLMSSDVIQPSKYLPHTLLYLQEDKADVKLSISRDSKRLSWGISVPNDSSQTMYVWFDALINYLSVTGFPRSNFADMFPPTIQVIGKDILKFHAIYWPCFLLAADLPLPKKLFVHSHWTVDAIKMSKSRGNVIDPIKIAEILTVDGLRYFLLKNGNPHEDSNFTQQVAIQVVNADLVNNLGNLVTRSTAPKINPDQKYPSTFELKSLEPDLQILADQLIKNLKTLSEKVGQNYDSLLFYKSLILITETSNLANVFFQHSKAWLDEPSVNQSLPTILFVTYETIRICALLLQHIVPNYSDKILTRLGVPKIDRQLDNCIFGGTLTKTLFGQEFGKNSMILERIQVDKKEDFDAENQMNKSKSEKNTRKS